MADNDMIYKLLQQNAINHIKVDMTLSIFPVKIYENWLTSRKFKYQP